MGPPETTLQILLKEKRNVPAATQLEGEKVSAKS